MNFIKHTKIPPNGLLVLLLLIVTLVVAILSYHHDSQDEISSNVNKNIKLSIDDIQKRGKLIAVTERNSTGYFLYRGEPTGFEYEMLKRFSAYLGVGLEVKVVSSLDSLFATLIRGEADIIASNITITKERLSMVKFTSPIFKTKQVLVQRIPNKTSNVNIIKNLDQLKGKEIHVRKNSAFHNSLLNLAKESNGNLNFVVSTKNLDMEQLIKKVADGEIDYTLADENISFISKAFYPNINIETEVGPTKKIAWAVNLGADELLEKMNEWLKRKETHHAFRVLYQKYFKDPKSALTRADSEYCSISGNISPYDELIKKYSNLINWDWRLVASLIAQESRFNHEAQSHMGASGLMQLMPAAYNYYLPGVENITPELSIKAGTKYLEKSEKFWKRYIFNKEERLKFVLASYNVGLGHVIDARRLAIKYDKNPNVWDNSVEYFLFQKSNSKYYTDPVVKHGYCRGSEPVNFVKKILARYGHYKNLI